MPTACRLDDAGIGLFAASRTGVAHCPCSNMRLASGIAPVRRLLNAGVPVGLGVDGSASNDGAHMVNEARQALLLARVGRAMQPPEERRDSQGERQTFLGCDLGPAEMSARDALALATRGGAQVLGRPDIGHLAPGMCADLALFRPANTVAFAGGAVHDPVGALLLCASPQAAWTVVNGRVVVRQGQLASRSGTLAGAAQPAGATIGNGLITRAQTDGVPGRRADPTAMIHEH